VKQPKAFKKRARQSKQATRESAAKPRKENRETLFALRGTYAILRRDDRAKTPQVIADPSKVTLAPVMTTSLEKALLFVGRTGAFKYMLRNPHLKKDFWYRRIA
jgi:hypothetical protein